MDGTAVSYPGANGGAVGGSSRRERYSVPGTAPLGKLRVISYHFTKLKRNHGFGDAFNILLLRVDV